MEKRMSFLNFLMSIFNNDLYLSNIRKEALSKVSQYVFGMRLEEHIHSIGETLVISLDASATSKKYGVVLKTIPSDKTLYVRTELLGSVDFANPLEAARLYKKLYLAKVAEVEEKKAHTI